jgi:hypothetical protein
MGPNTITHNASLFSGMSVTGERVSESGLQNFLDAVLAKLIVNAPLQIACEAPLQRLALLV